VAPTMVAILSGGMPPAGAAAAAGGGGVAAPLLLLLLLALLASLVSLQVPHFSMQPLLTSQCSAKGVRK